MFDIQQLVRIPNNWVQQHKFITLGTQDDRITALQDPHSSTKNPNLKTNCFTMKKQDNKYLVLRNPYNKIG